jgi:hypothetical protein
MSLFSRLLPNRKRNNNNHQCGDTRRKNALFSPDPSTEGDDFAILSGAPRCGDSYLYNAWVHIAVNILIRNIARDDFAIKRGGDEVTIGPLYELLRRPNTALSR